MFFLCRFEMHFFFGNVSYPVWVLIDARNVIKLELSLRRPLNWKFPVLQLLRLPTVWLIEIVQMFSIYPSVRPPSFDHVLNMFFLCILVCEMLYWTIFCRLFYWTTSCCRLVHGITFFQIVFTGNLFYMMSYRIILLSLHLFEQK